MVLVSYSGKEINAKLVYYGPGLSGKTTNLEYIYGSIPGTHRGKMVSMKTKTERTLFFDFLPVQLGELSGFKTRFLLYTVPGQVYYNATRKLVLKGVDAVVFVADSKRGKMDENVESLQNLRENLLEHGHKLEDIPFVLQYNKRDLPEVYSISELDQVLNPMHVPAFEAVATSGPGVVETFKAVSKLLLKKLADEIGVPIVGTGKSDGIELGNSPAPAPSPAGAGSIPAQQRVGSAAGQPASNLGASPIPAAPSAGATSSPDPARPAAIIRPASPGGSPNQPARPAGGIFAQEASGGGKGAWSGSAEDSGDSELRVARHEVSFQPSEEAPAESRSEGGFTTSMGAPVHGAPAARSSAPEEVGAPPTPTGSAPIPTAEPSRFAPSDPSGAAPVPELPPLPAEARSGRPQGTGEEDSRTGGVAARLRKWLKRDDASDSADAPGWETEAPARSTYQPLGSTAPATAPKSSSLPPHEQLETVPRASSGAPHDPMQRTPDLDFGAARTGAASDTTQRTSAREAGTAPAASTGGPSHHTQPILDRELGTAAHAPTSAANQADRTIPREAVERALGRAHEEGLISDRSSERMSDRRDEMLSIREARSRSQAREITVPVELTAQDLEFGVVVRLAVRLRDDVDDGAHRRAA